MSKFKAIFTLKQHTPIIHFQSDQSGATLRATELKPKFDRFLIELFEQNKTDYKDYLISGKEKALDYKVTILTQATDIITERIEKVNNRNGKDINDPLFFGNMKPKDISVEKFEKIRKKFKIHKKNFQIEFFSYNIAIIKSISENFEKFIANNNFGTRQSKGFGSFYLVDDKTRKEKLFNKSLIPYIVYSFSSKKDKYRDDIKLFYSFLRQGINYPKGQENCPKTRFYTKPAIFSYAKSKSWVWDKKAIKEKYFSSKLKSDIECRGEVDLLTYNSEHKYLLRDLFGLSSSQEWKSYGKTITKEGISKEKVNKKDVVKIQRFKSPITFKPILDDDKNMTIYFWANDTISDVLNEDFTIKQDNSGDLILYTPTHFSFNEFFDFTFNINLQNHIQEEFQNEREFKSLERILKSIKESK